MDDVNEITPSNGGDLQDMAEGTPVGTRRVTDPSAPVDGQRGYDPTDSRFAKASEAGPPRGILRLSHVDVMVTDLDLSVAYYTEVMGMEVTARTDDMVYLKCWDEEDHHSLRLRYASRTGMDLMSFKVH